MVAAPEGQLEAYDFEYVAHTDADTLASYDADNHVYTMMPLYKVLSLTSVSMGRTLAGKHGITNVRRIRLPELKARASVHSCYKCNLLYTVFKLVPSKETARLTKKKEKAKANKEAINRRRRINYRSTLQTGSAHSKITFPPTPPTDQFIRDMIGRCCQKMDANNIEEDGCAVCGRLVPKTKLSNLRHVARLLDVLVVPGVMRKERKSLKDASSHDTEPVLDRTCSCICDTCRADIRKRRIPADALARGTWIGNVPRQLSELRFMERMLIARVRHTCTYVRISNGMKKMKANVIAFENPTPLVYDHLPPPRKDMDDVLAIMFTGPNKPTKDDFKRAPVLVRRNKVIEALEWLKLNHSDYHDIEISRENMNEYPEDVPFVGVEYKASVTNKTPEGLSVHDNEEEDGYGGGRLSFYSTRFNG